MEASQELSAVADLLAPVSPQAAVTGNGTAVPGSAVPRPRRTSSRLRRRPLAGFCPAGAALSVGSRMGARSTGVDRALAPWAAYPLAPAPGPRLPSAAFAPPGQLPRGPARPLSSSSAQGQAMLSELHLLGQARTSSETAFGV